MAANAGVVKAIGRFFRTDSDTAFERHRSRMPINDVKQFFTIFKTIFYDNFLTIFLTMF